MPFVQPTPPARATPWEWTQAALLAAGLIWTTLCLGGYRAETMVVTSALNAALLVTYFLSRAFGCAPRTHLAGWFFLPFLIYAATNVAFVTPVPWLGWRDWLLWAQMIAVFWVALNGLRSPAVWRALVAAIAALGAVAVALACYQRFVQPDWLMLGRTQAEQFIGRAGGPFGIPNSLGAMLGLLFPPAIAWAFARDAGGVRRGLGGYLAAVFLLGLVLTVSRGAWISLGLALAAWPLLAQQGSWPRRLGASVLVIGAALAAGAMLYFAVPGVQARFDALISDAGEKTRPIMWRGAWTIFRAHPALGGGAGAYDVLFEKYRPENYQDEPVWSHNDYLNTLADYGAAGFILFFGAAVLVGQRCLRGLGAAPAQASALAVGLLAFALQTFTDFNLKIPALAMLAAVLAAALVRVAWPTEDEARLIRRRRRILPLVAAVVVPVCAAAFVIPLYHAEAERYAAREDMDQLARVPVASAEERAVLTKARASFVRATARDPANGHAWADLSYSIALLARLDPAREYVFGRAAEAAAERALGCSQMVPEFWIRHGVGRDLQGRHGAADSDFARALELAPKSAIAWFYQAYHLSLESTLKAHSDAGLAVETCLRLDPGNRAAVALQLRLAPIAPAR
jgi:O-antigen ligase